MLGIQAFGASRAFPYETVLREKLVKDHVGPEPIILVVGPDNQSVRVFRTHQDSLSHPGNRAIFPNGRIHRKQMEFPRLRDRRQIRRRMPGAAST